MDQNQTNFPPPPPPPPTGGGNVPMGEDKLNVGLTILSFCIPLAGAIIFFMKKDNEPKSAKTACYAAIAGVVLGIIINIIFGGLGLLMNN